MLVSLNAEGWFVVAGLLVAFLRAKRGLGGQDANWTAGRFDALALAAIALSAIALYAWTARSYFLADDFILLVQAHAPLSWRAVFATRGGDGSFRPIGYLSYVFSAKWAGTYPEAWHWIGYVMHIANAILVYVLAAALGYSRFAAWLGATLFALHGAHPEAVVWMAGRFDLLSTFFFLVAILAFVCSRRNSGGRRMLFEAMALGSMTAGMLSKESAYSFPLVAALLVACSGEARLQRSWRLALGFFGVAGVLFVYRWNLLGGIGGYGGISLAPALKALAFRMWAVLFFPINWSIPHGLWLNILSLIYLAILARLFFVRVELRRLVFAVGFAALTAAPAVSQLLIGVDMEKSRVLYLPSIGVCMLLAALCEPLRFKDQVVVAAVLILFHGMVLWHNLEGWQKASEVVRSACAVAAKCESATGRRALVTGLPRTLDGVYAFANGFQECVAMQGEGRANPPAADAADCRFAWDAPTQSLRVVH